MPLDVVACVAESEQPIVRRAAEEIARAVGAVTPEMLDCRCRFVASPDELAQLEDGAIAVASLLREVDSVEAWSSIEQRLREMYSALAARNAPAFICTVFRHVGRSDDGAADAARLVRIRRLNLLAMEISRLTGAYVIDLDRALSDIGGLSLKTNYLLAGRVAADQAAYVIAGSLIADALAGVVPVDVQDAAAARLDATRPAVDDPGGNVELTLLPKAVPIGYGRRSRSAKPIMNTVQASRVDTVLRNVLRGTIGPREIGSRLMRALRQRGLRTTTKLLAAGLAKQLQARR